MGTRRLMGLNRTPLAVCVAAVFATGLAGAPGATTAATPESTRSLSGQTRPAAVLPVTSCADDGSPGTLREVVAGAASGDTVDLTQLTCSQITLLSGHIEVQVDDLTIQGPGVGSMMIDGNYIGRVFNHGGGGTLTIDALTITRGLLDIPGFSTVYGGCINSGNGSVALNNSLVTGCKTSAGFQSRGGGIAARMAVTVNQSTVSNNVAMATGYYSYFASGGGIHAGQGPLTITASLIDGNRSEISDTQDHPGIDQAGGGGVSCYGSLVSISDSVISNNFAGCNSSTTSCYQAVGGGVRAINGLIIASSHVIGNVGEAARGRVIGGGISTQGSDVSGSVLSIVNSVISDNHARGLALSMRGGGLNLAAASILEEITGSIVSDNTAAEGGGIFVSDGQLKLSNTTVSGNSASLSGGGISVQSSFPDPIVVENSTVTLNVSSGPDGGGGIVDFHSYGISTFQSSIIAGNINTADTPAYDADLGVAGGEIQGANNLIVAASGVTLPPDTLSVDPMLGPLQDNGGLTWTHALLAGSPAIDAGNNAANLDYDQRGEGYSRVSGFAADIGAFEVQQATTDIIFASGFE